MFFLGCSIYIYIYMYSIYICGHPLPEPPSSIQYIGQCYHFAKVSLFQCNLYIYIYVDAQLILNMYISFHSYIYIYTHMSYTSYVLMIVAFNPPPFLALKHAFSSMGSLQDGSNVMKPLNIEMVKCDCTFANVEARWKLGEYMLFNVV